MEKHSSSIVTKSVGTLFKRFHLILFFIFVVACLAVAVVLINQILTGAASDTPYTSTINAGSIDRATLNQVQSLHTSDSAATPPIPEGRNNPFAE
jgi:hypothetical protein